MNKPFNPMDALNEKKLDLHLEQLTEIKKAIEHLTEATNHLTDIATNIQTLQKNVAKLSKIAEVLYLKKNIK